MKKVTKKIYLAGKVDRSEDLIATFAKELESRDHEVIQKWFLNSTLPKPYLDNISTSRPRAESLFNAAYECDIFILFPTEDVLGAAVEFGAAIASTLHNENKIVIVINPYETRQSVFYAHPKARTLKNLSDIKKNPGSEFFRLL